MGTQPHIVENSHQLILTYRSGCFKIRKGSAQCIGDHPLIRIHDNSLMVSVSDGIIYKEDLLHFLGRATACISRLVCLHYNHPWFAGQGDQRII